MNIWYVESNAAWFLVKAKTKAIARHEGVVEFGRGITTNVRLATEDEIRYFLSLKSDIGEAG